MTSEVKLSLKISANEVSNLRFILDLVCVSMDERNTEETRLEASNNIADHSNLYHAMGSIRERCRDLSNLVTDMGIEYVLKTTEEKDQDNDKRNKNKH